MIVDEELESVWTGKKTPQQALETYKDAMVASGVTTTRPQDNDTFTRLYAAEIWSV